MHPARANAKAAIRANPLRRVRIVVDMPLLPYLTLSPSLTNSESASVQKSRGVEAPARMGLDEVWLVRHLKEGDLVALHVRYRLVTDLR
jgi:hypothetical protein